MFYEKKERKLIFADFAKTCFNFKNSLVIMIFIWDQKVLVLLEPHRTADQSHIYQFW